MRVLSLLPVALGVLVLCHCSADAGADAPADEPSSAEEALRYNGGNTGAFLREMTPAGYSCIRTRLTVPDYTGDEATQGTPWIYFGFGDEARLDMEVGLAFQKGNGTAEKPRRYLPYMRLAQTFYFAPEAERVLPTETTELVARLVGDKVYLRKDDRPITLKSSAGESITFLRVPGLEASRTHVRRVVGQVTRVMDYRGTRLGTLGPVVFDGTRVCDSRGDEVPFTGSVASYSRTENGVTHGTSVWPARYVSRTRSGAGGEREEVWLFR